MTVYSIVKYCAKRKKESFLSFLSSLESQSMSLRHAFLTFLIFMGKLRWPTMIVYNSMCSTSTVHCTVDSVYTALRNLRGVNAKLHPRCLKQASSVYLIV